MRDAILLFGYEAEVGKDTMCDYLVSEKGYTKFAFAKELKDQCMRKYRFTYDQVYDKFQKNIPDPRYPKVGGGFWTPREVLQTEGQNARAIFPEVWATFLAHQIADHYHRERNVNPNHSIRICVCDFRFPNEFQAIKSMAEGLDRDVSVHTIHVNRPGVSRDFAGSKDVSETSLLTFPFDARITNDGSLSDLYQITEELLVKLDLE